MSPEQISPVVLDLSSLCVAEANAALRAVGEPSQCEHCITSIDGHAYLAAGLNKHLKLQLRGSCGSFLGLLNAAAEMDVDGNVGDACGHSMSGGSILVRGHATYALAAFARGGFIGVHGTARAHCALMLDGADVVVRQAVGREAGYGMRSGNLVIGNDAGEALGRGCSGGTIYLRGNAASIASELREVRMRDSDAMRLSLLLARAGIRAATKDFRVLRPRARNDE